MRANDFETNASRLVDKSATTSERLEIVNSVKDGIEIAHTSEYGNFLKTYFPAFREILTTLTRPTLVDGDENALRFAVFEILNRLPFNEVLRPLETELLELTLAPLREENEKNALLCLRIIFDLYRNFRPSMDKKALPFLTFVKDVYEGAEETIGELLGGDNRKRGKKDKLPSSCELRGTKSFKVMTECPLIVMLLFQLYSQTIQNSVAEILPIMVRMIGLSGGDVSTMSEDAQDIYGDLKAAQVKTVSFITYLLRGNVALVEPYQKAISTAIVGLLQTCPDIVAPRKELLVATRHVLGSQTFCKAFFAHLDMMMDDRVLVGTGRRCIENLRPLAYSFLAELVHHMKAELTLSQIRRAIFVFSRNMQDNTLPLSTHMTCARLMHHLVESIFRMRSDAARSSEARQFLIRILYVTVAKFRSLRPEIAELVTTANELEKAIEAKAKNGDSGADAKSKEAEVDDEDLDKLMPPTTPSAVEAREAGDNEAQQSDNNTVPMPSHDKLKSLSDTKAIVKTLTIGMKTLLWSITNFGPDSQVPTSGLDHIELKRAAGFLRNGMKSMQLFRGAECSEMCTHFSEALVVLEARNFVDIICLHFDHLFTGMLELPTLVQVPHLLLGNQKLCKYFADALVTYLLEHKLACLSDPSSQETQLVLKLFSLLLHAVSKHSNCEAVLAAHVIPMIEACLKAIKSLQDPSAYVRLLRYLFRAMAQAKFDVLYREVVPILATTLDSLLSLLDGPDPHDLQDTVVELCLILPARLSTILSHLPKLAQPLCRALRAPVSELNLLGLRTLEFWVDSLNPEFLDPCIAQVESDLMLALWAMLKPQQSGSPFGAKAMQLLGKLGGRNRAFLRDPLELDAKGNPEHGLRMILMFKPETSFLVPLDRCIVLMQTILSTPMIANVKASDALIRHRRQALTFIRTCLVSVLNLNAGHAFSGTRDEIAEALEVAVTNGWGEKIDANQVAESGPAIGNKTKSQLMAEQGVFKQLVVTVIAAECDPLLKETDEHFLDNICEHIAMLFVRNSTKPEPSPSSPTDYDYIERPRLSNLKVLDATLFLDALMTSFEYGKQAHITATLSTIQKFIDTVIILSRDEMLELQALEDSIEKPSGAQKKGKKSKAEAASPMDFDESSYPKVSAVVEALVPRLVHCCYKKGHLNIIGGVAALDIVYKSFPAVLMKRRLPDVLSAMIRAIHSLPKHASSQIKDATSIFLRVVEKCVPAGATFRGEDQSVDDSIAVLVSELCSVSGACTSRAAVEQALMDIAKRTNTSMCDLLHLQDETMAALVDRSLQSRHVLSQIQMVKLLNFCLSASPTLIKLKDNYLVVVQDALSIAESEDPSVSNVETRENESLSILRQSCVQLLSTALSTPELSSTEAPQPLVALREHISTVLFSSLTSRNPSIVAIAKLGLVEVKPHMNKNTLKQSVSPILMSLQHLSKLSVPLLGALEYLLELLSEWFSPTLGEKLLEHIKYWLELDANAAVAPGQIKKSPKDVKLIAAIVNLFHLLPKLRDSKAELKANEKRLLPYDFIHPLVRDIMAIESSMPPESVYSEVNSLYMVPLTKFLAKYPKESVDYFLARLDQPNYFSRFIRIIQLAEGAELLKTLCASSSKLLKVVFGAQAETDDELDELATQGVVRNADEHLTYYNGLKLISTMANKSPEWLSEEPSVMELLEESWGSEDRLERMNNEDKHSLPSMMETKYIVKCFISMLRHDRSQVRLLYKLLPVLCNRSSVDYTFVREFIHNEVVDSYEPKERNAVFKEFLDHFNEEAGAGDGADPTLLECALQVLVIPMLRKTLVGCQDSSQAMDAAQASVDEVLIDRFVAETLDPADEEGKAIYSESLRIHLLQLSTLLIRNLPDDLVKHRKELIKFGWNHLKREDSSSKQWAFVNVSYFLQAYQAPEKIILQVFVALLRASQPEQSELVTEALDALTPALPIRLSQGDHKYPIWIRYTKKSLVEDGHSFPQLVHIWNLIARHSKFFYTSRAQFVPQMVNSLSRLGLPTSSSQSNRALSIDLVELIITWEIERVSSADGNKQLPTATSLGKRKATESPEREEDARRGKKSVVKKTKKEEVESKSPRSTRGSRSTKKSTKDDDDENEEMVSDLPETETLKSIPSIGIDDEEFKPSPNMAEIIINFLVRMTFITGESKETDAMLLNKRSLHLLARALKMWPTVRIKFSFIDKLLSLAKQASRDQTTTLIMSLSVLKTAFMSEEYEFVSDNIQQITRLLEPCYASQSRTVHELLAEVVSIACPSLGGDEHAEDATELRTTLTALYNRSIGSDNVDANPPSNSQANPSLACVLKVSGALAKHKANSVDQYLPLLMKLLARLTVELNAASASAELQADQPKRSQSPPEVLEPEYGNVAFCMVECVNLISLRVAVAAGSEHKQVFLRLLLQLINDKTTHGNVLMAILDAMVAWTEDSRLGESWSQEERESRAGSLNAKETVLFLSKLAQLTRMGIAITQTPNWEEKLLGMIHRLCSSEGKHDPALRSEVFLKVERTHLLGLRTRRPELRQKFFALYHEAIGTTLFQRLQYILTIQDWDAMADTFWLMQGLDLILSTLAEDERISLAPNSALIPSLLPNDPETKKPADIPSKPKNAKVVSPELSRLIQRHAQFLHEKASVRVADLMTPLRQVATRNANIAYYLWVLIFPIVWATLQREEQLQLAKPMIGLLSKESHLRQAAVRPNVIQALLEGISLSQPQLKIPSELIKFLGKTFNAWHTAIALLENHVVRYPQEARCFDALSELYRLLSENDVLVGLWTQRCQSDITRSGLSLVQHGHWQDAQEVFFKGIQRATAGQAPGVSKTEMCLWETQWLNSAKQLNQWDLISDFSRTVEHSELMVQSMWRLSDWAGVKELMPSGTLNEIEETPEIVTIRAFASLVSGRVREAEQHWAHAVKSSLDRWWLLPETGSTCHIPSLHTFNAIAEVQESTRILLDLSNTQRRGVQGLTNNRTLVQDIMETWRLRTPNDWDPIPWWSEILMWRGNMHNIMTHAAKQIGEQNPAMLQTTQQLDQLGQRERAWSLNKFASSARKQRLPEVALAILSRHQGQVEVSEAFSKLREQCQAYLALESEAVTGLNILESTSLEFFSPPQKAELFRLRGKFQEQLQDFDAANASYSTAVSLCKQLSEAWISWGNFCRDRKDDTSANWVQQTATCYLQGVKNNVQESRHELINVVQMLAFSANHQPVGLALARHIDELPAWIWIPWIPQLLLSLVHNEAPHAKAILLRVVQAHPQAIYYQLRTCLLERRDYAARATQTARTLAELGKSDEKSKAATASAPSVQASAQRRAQEASVAFEAAKELMESLRHKHTNLVGELEVLLSELGTRFACTPEERLLVVVYTLLHRCYKYPAATTGEVPETFKKELIGVCRACFSADTSTKHSEFVDEYQASYERDLNPEQESFPETVAELMMKLKAWKQRLLNDVEDRLPPTLRLEDESTQLRNVTFNEVEVPGQYNGDLSFGIMERFTKLERIGADVFVVRRHGSSYRGLQFVGVDGSSKQFLVQTSLTPAARGEERMVQLLDTLNSVFAKHSETRRRGMCYYTPAVVPVWPQVRLLEDDAAHATYGEVYDVNCARYGREADLPVALFKTALDPAILGKVTGTEEVLELRLKALMEITQKHVTENIFSQYMYKTLPNGSHLWTFKRQLSQQLAMSSFLSALLRIGGRTPSKIMFAKNTGKLFMLDFHPAFDNKGIIEYVEPVPFRLTRNLHTFFTPFGVKGDFVAAMASAAQACAAPEADLEAHLELFFRDQLMVWPWRRMNGPSNVAVNPSPAEIKAMARSNVQEVLRRLTIIAPTPPPNACAMDSTPSVQKAVLHLVDAALNIRNVARMESTWAPWF